MNKRRSKGGGNINKVQELAAERTKYCPRVALETPFVRKQASRAAILVSGMEGKVRGNCCSESLSYKQLPVIFHACMSLI
jgi:hypothetical protein